MSEFKDFIVNDLIPIANKVLKTYYSDYCDGKDIDIKIKDDESPASRADRMAELELRKAIKKRYPTHGIWGEEFGGDDLDSEYVWILDPLDGTRQFLEKQDGCFVVLIGLFKNNKPYFGAVSDPLSGQIWMDCQKLNNKNVEISDMIVASTAPNMMFDRNTNKENIMRFLSNTKNVINCRNAKSFLDVIDGYADVGIESNLSLHDIAALIPVCAQSGCITTDFDGNDYSTQSFVFSRDKYDFLVTRNIETTNKILEQIRK